MTAIGLRPTTPVDSEYCFELHKAAMGAYARAISGWGKAVQRDYHAHAFNPDRWQIIAVDGMEAGIPEVEQRARDVAFLQTGRPERA